MKSLKTYLNESPKSIYLGSTGFTLIEVLVVVAVTGILTTLASVIFINTVRNSKKSEITSEARQNAALVIDRMQKDARSASGLSVTNSGRRLTITQSGGTVIWECTLGSGGNNGRFTRNAGSGALTATNRDPVDGVSVSACAFSPDGVGIVNTASLAFTLSEGEAVGSGPQEYGVNLQFDTSISVRE